MIAYGDNKWGWKTGLKAQVFQCFFNLEKLNSPYYGISFSIFVQFLQIIFYFIFNHGF